MQQPSVIDTRNIRSGVKLDEQYIGALTKNYPSEGQLKNAIFYINADTHDTENVANGSLAIYDVDAVVNPESIPASMFEHVIAVPILDHSSKPEGWKDADFTEKLATLQAAAPQYSANPPTLDKQSNTSSADGDVWSPELGTGFAGIFKKTRSNQRDSDYYIVVKGSAELASQQLREQLISEGGSITFGKLLKDPRVAYVNSQAIRNCKRLAYNIAHAMQLPIPHTVDVSSYAPTSYAAKPFRAEPTAHRQGYQQSISSIQPVDWKGKEAVGIFHRVRPVNEAKKHNLVIGNPYDGITVFHMENTPMGFAVPADTGMARNLDEADLSHRDTAKRHQNIVWEGPEKALKALAHNVNHEVDNDFYRGMNQYGWKQGGRNTVSQLVPVILKMSNADLKR
jgi:hypothetical protein